MQSASEAVRVSDAGGETGIEDSLSQVQTEGDDEPLIDLERDGKYVFGTLKYKGFAVYERVPVHVMYQPEDVQRAHFLKVCTKLNKKMNRLLASKGKPPLPRSVG